MVDDGFVVLCSTRVLLTVVAFVALTFDVVVLLLFSVKTALFGTLDRVVTDFCDEAVVLSSETLLLLLVLTDLFTGVPPRTLLVAPPPFERLTTLPEEATLGLLERRSPS